MKDIKNKRFEFLEIYKMRAFLFDWESLVIFHATVLQFEYSEDLMILEEKYKQMLMQIL